MIITMSWIKEAKYTSTEQTYHNKEDLFLAYLWYYEGGFTYCCELQEWMSSDDRLEWADSVKEFKQRMAWNSVYEDRHFRKVDGAYDHFLERIAKADLQLPASVNQVP